MSALFTKTKDLVLKIDSFLDLTSESSLHFQKAVVGFIGKDKEGFEERLEILRDLESDADHVRKDIEIQLYQHTLIPESRGDVLGILESMDDIIDQIKAAAMDFSIETPEIPEFVSNYYNDLLVPVCKTVESLVQSARAYFYELHAVKDHLHLVKFNEKEADRIAEKLKREIFSSDLGLSHKVHLRYFVIQIDMIADASEQVADRISIAAIKRSF